MLSTDGDTPWMAPIRAGLGIGESRQVRASSRKDDPPQGPNTGPPQCPCPPRSTYRRHRRDGGPFSRTEAEAIDPSFKVSLGRVIYYTGIYIYANYMRPRTVTNG